MSNMTTTPEHLEKLRRLAQAWADAQHDSGAAAASLGAVQAMNYDATHARQDLSVALKKANAAYQAFDTYWSELFRDALSRAEPPTTLRLDADGLRRVGTCPRWLQP